MARLALLGCGIAGLIGIDKDDWSRATCNAGGLYPMVERNQVTTVPDCQRKEIKAASNAATSVVVAPLFA